MELIYSVKIEDPKSHIAVVDIKGNKPAKLDRLSFFIPSWSPGSYLMREYGKNIRTFKAESELGETLFHEQVDKGVFCVDWSKSELKKAGDSFHIRYEIYCHELTVRTSHIDESHAFIHGPATLMGVLDQELVNPKIELHFPASWTKVSTGLKDISEQREKFLFAAKNYDELIDSPIEIGCHETDGFSLDGKDHELAFYGSALPHGKDLKADIKKITKHIADYMGGMPYDEKYTYITHFAAGHFGGLEHSNSTALQFCPFMLSDEKGYTKWLELVAHEYFHTWNVKRIRPKELGPFDYLNEAKTKMHWLTEGLTSFMDQLFIYRMEFIDEKGYAELMKENLLRYYSIPGKKFHSLEQSSFNAWIKLYRPDEFSNNSSMSYYLKGGLVFFSLHILLQQKGKSVDDVIKALWAHYQERPEIGLIDEEVYQIIEKIGGEEILSKFQTMITTTEDIDFDSIMTQAGFEIEWDNSDDLSWGITPKFVEGRVVIGSVALDGSAYKSGLNAGDEIIAFNGHRVLKAQFDKILKAVKENTSYKITVSRLNALKEIDMVFSKPAKKIKEIKVKDESRVKAIFKTY